MSRRRRGAQAVEFALVLPVLIALMTGIFDWGWLMFHHHLAADVASVGARAGASVNEEDDPESVAEDAAKQRWSDLGLSASPEVEARTSGGSIEVQVRFGDLRLVGLVPGPKQSTVVRSRRQEESTVREGAR